MRNVGTLILASLAAISVPLLAQDKPIESPGQKVERGNAPQSGTWTKVLTERTKRGTLHDAFQNVRGVPANGTTPRSCNMRRQSRRSQPS